MAEIIREADTKHVIHHNADEGSNPLGVLIAIILVIAIAIFFIYYGLPYLRSAMTPSVAVPEQVDVNVNSR